MQACVHGGMHGVQPALVLGFDMATELRPLVGSFYVLHNVTCYLLKYFDRYYEVAVPNNMYSTYFVNMNGLSGVIVTDDLLRPPHLPHRSRKL